MKLVKILGKSEVFVNALTKLIDASFDSGVFPSSWKSAKVVPVFKSGDPSDVDNYRPISVLNCLSKIIERVAFNHIYAFLIKENLLHILQSGFRHRHSTCTALVHLIDKVYNDMDNCKLTGGLFLDLRKAFDTVNHDIMLKKFARFNPSRKMTQWLLSYLSCRKQAVDYNGIMSHGATIYSGVPQGSILGPLLFLIYVNDLPTNLSSEVVMLLMIQLFFHMGLLTDLSPLICKVIWIRYMTTQSITD